MDAANFDRKPGFRQAYTAGAQDWLPKIAVPPVVDFRSREAAKQNAKCGAIATLWPLFEANLDAQALFALHDNLSPECYKRAFKKKQRKKVKSAKAKTHYLDPYREREIPLKPGG